MDLFERMIPKDNKKQRIRLAQVICGVNVIRLTFATILLYMVPIAISKYLVDIMNFYVIGILSGLTGAYWGLIISRALKDRDDLMIFEPWLSDEKYRSLMVTLSNSTLKFIIGIGIEIVVIAVFNIY